MLHGDPATYHERVCPMTDAQARAAFADPAAAPSHVEMFGIAGALDRAGAQLPGGLEPKLAGDVLTLWFRKTWRSAARVRRHVN